MHGMWETGIRSLGQDDSLEEEMATTPVFLPGKFHGQRSLAGYSPWGCKELNMTEQLSTAQYAHGYMARHFSQRDQ